MHLKTLTLRGFKSFASATRLELEPGITCVVGPNGSGKSNVVDALSWVMGEQGAKSLRGASMADVIFAGTSKRQGLGRAEVTLTIDNTDGALPIDYSEVTISRTLFRGGGSEYAINGTSCRLLDIQELLSDTGMGRQMHVIVGQGQLDSILSANPLERRGFIEEAAGVLKHRRRRERAERKLVNLADKLSRLEDLTGEVRRQLGPLARQASLAKRASVIQATANDARLRLLADDIVVAKARLASHDDRAVVVLKKREELAQRKSQQAEKVELLERERRAQLPLLRATTELATTATTLRERYCSTVALIDERLRTAKDNGSTGDVPDLLVLQADVERRELEDREAAQRVDELDAQRQQVRLELAAADEVLDQVRRKLRAAQERAHQHERAVAQAESGVASAQASLDAAHEAQMAAKESFDNAERRLEDARVAVSQAPALVIAGADTERLEQLRNELDTARNAVDKANELVREAQSQISHWRSRRDTLSMTLASLTATADSEIDAALPVFAGQIDVQSGWETAIAAALGMYANAVIRTTWKSAFNWIKSDNASGYSVIVEGGSAAQGSASASYNSDSALDVDEADDIYPAFKLVDSPDAKVSAILAAFFEGIVCVNDLDTARAAIKLSGVRTAITRSGVVLTAHSMGRSGVRNSAVHIQSALKEATKELGRAEKQFEDANQQLAICRQQLEAASLAHETLLAQIRQIDRERAQNAQRLGELHSAVASAEAEIERRQLELDRANTRVTQADEALRGFAVALDACKSSNTDDDIDQLTQDVVAAEQKVSQLREKETDARLAEHQARDAARAAQGRARSARQALAAGRELLDKIRHKQAVANATEKRLVALRGLVVNALSAVESTATSLIVRKSELETASLIGGESIDLARAELDSMIQELADITDSTHRDEVARAELSLALEQCMLRLDDQGLGEDTLLATYGPHMMIPGEDGQSPRPFDRGEQEEIARHAERELKRLGAVNPLALEEHNAAQQRYDYLAGQLKDLKQSRSDLQGLLRDIDKRVAEAFDSAFADTQEQFKRVFETLFPGGSGRLVLVEDENGGDPGIEIEARPAGKKVRRLSLLSGGERSLAALAFVIAIFKARPSPFYVMDEVEAALDDANLGRILEIFEDLRQTSQLLVITHQKRTMEAATALYGVTMRDGVSTVVSQRLDDK